MKGIMKKIAVLLVLMTMLTGAMGIAPAQAATAASKKVTISTIKLGKKNKSVKYQGRIYKPSTKNWRVLLAKITNKTSKKIKRAEYTVTLYNGSKKLGSSKRYTTNLAKKTSYILAWEVSPKVTKVKYKVTYAK